MQINWTTRDSRTHSIRLGMADYCLHDLMGFEKFKFLHDFAFNPDGGPWVTARLMGSYLWLLELELEAQKLVLPYSYGADDDFGGGESVVIDGETWALHVGAGECSLSQLGPLESQNLPDHPGTRRLVKWVDLRGQRKLQVDGRLIKLSRRRREFRWYAELPGLRQYIQGIPLDMEVRAVRGDQSGAVPAAQAARPGGSGG